MCEVSVNSSHQLQAHMTGMNKPRQVPLPTATGSGQGVQCHVVHFEFQL